MFFHFSSVMFAVFATACRMLKRSEIFWGSLGNTCSFQISQRYTSPGVTAKDSSGQEICSFFGIHLFKRFGCKYLLTGIAYRGEGTIRLKSHVIRCDGNFAKWSEPKFHFTPVFCNKAVVNKAKGSITTISKIKH